jgi:hypothetical protein
MSQREVYRSCRGDEAYIETVDHLVLNQESYAVPHLAEGSLSSRESCRYFEFALEIGLVEGRWSGPVLSFASALTSAGLTK